MTHAIRRIACHPAVWPGFGGASDPEAWTPPMGEGFEWWLGEDVVVCFIRLRPSTWEAHIGALPSARGTVKAQAIAAIEWLRDKHGSGLLMGFIPRGNPAAVANARAVGMKVLARTPDSTVMAKEF